MATSGVASWSFQHDLHIALTIATYIISSGRSVFGVSVQRMNWEIVSSGQATTQAGSQLILNSQQCEQQHIHCPTLIAPLPPSIQYVATYSLYLERPPEDQRPLYAVHSHGGMPPKVDFPFHEDTWMARQVQYNLVILVCLPWPHTKKYVIWGSFFMQWEGGNGNELLPTCSCNSVSMRRKLHSEFHIQSHNCVHMGIARILWVCSIWISRWCNIEVHPESFLLSSHLQRCFLALARQQKGNGQTQCRENGTCKEVNGRRRNKFWNFDGVRAVAWSESLVVFY